MYNVTFSTVSLRITHEWVYVNEKYFTAALKNITATFSL